MAVLSTSANIATPGLPVGSIQAFAGANAPTGWLLCDGSAVSRGNYPDLYNTIGNTYGSGDGSTTFNLPDLRGRMPIGPNSDSTAANTATRSVGTKGGDTRMQTHTHIQNAHGHDLGPGQSFGMAFGNQDAAFAVFKVAVSSINGGSYQGPYSANSTTATNQNAGSGSSDNMPPFLVTNYIIKATADIARGGWYTQSSPPVVTQLPSNPAIGEEVYYLFTGTNNLGNICHIRWNGTRWTIISPTTLVRWNCGSASQVISTTNVVNITTGDYGTVSFTPPWDGWYEFGINLRNVQLASGIGISVYLSNANFSANYEVAYFEDVNGYVYHTKIPITGPRVDYLYASNTYRWASSITYAAGNTGTLFTSGVAYVKAVG